MIDSKKQWNIIDEKLTSSDQAQLQELELNPVVYRILKNKGYTSDEIQAFLNPSPKNLYDPYLMHDMQKGVERIQQAVIEGQKIVIYGDYDVDGITSTSIMYESLEQLGANVIYYIPDRFKDGYGPNKEAYQRLIEDGAQLIVTVDNGIAGKEAIEFAQKQGVDVVVTDHHEIPNDLPDAYAIIHPRFAGSEYPFGGLSGAGVAFKVAAALLEELPEDALDLVALGTVADIVPLKDENRILVKYGLQVLNQTIRPGIISLLEKSGIAEKKVTTDTIGYSIAPRLNALGRIENANEGVELLTTLDDQRADQLAEKTVKLNAKRQDIVNDIYEQALAMLDSKQDDLVNVVAAKGWHEGVLGIVASRLVDQTGKPTIVLGIDSKTNIAKGSGRSIEAFHMFNALDGHRDILEKFGGHHMACGLSIDVNKVPQLNAVLNLEAKKQNLTEKSKEIQDVYELSIKDATLEMYEELNALEPFGEENPRPTFYFKDFQLESVNLIGKKQETLKLKVSGVDAIKFNVAAAEYTEIKDNTTAFQFIGNLAANTWKNQTNIQIQISDMKLNSSEPQKVNEPNKVVVARKTQLKTGDFLAANQTYIFFNEKLYQNVRPHLVHGSRAFLYNDFSNLAGKEAVIVDFPLKLKDFEILVPQLKKFDKITFWCFPVKSAAKIGLPSRNDYAKVYRFFKSVKGVDLKKDANKLANTLQMKKDLLVLIMQVFFEVGFVKIDNGVVSGVDNVAPQNLEQSEVYQKHLQKIKSEQVFLTSNPAKLEQWINELIK